MCCPKFNPTPWDNQIHKWENKRFIKDRVRTFFYIPIGFGKTMERLDGKIRKARIANPDWLCLSEHTSKWNMNVLLAVEKEVPDTENITLSGKFFSKVYEGDFKNTEQWMKDFDNELQKRNFKADAPYMWYTTCPKCSKKYGKNYVVVIAKIQ